MTSFVRLVLASSFIRPRIDPNKGSSYARPIQIGIRADVTSVFANSIASDSALPAVRQSQPTKPMATIEMAPARNVVDNRSIRLKILLLLHLNSALRRVHESDRDVRRCL